MNTNVTNKLLNIQGNCHMVLIDIHYEYENYHVIYVCSNFIWHRSEQWIFTKNNEENR